MRFPIPAIDTLNLEPIKEILTKSESFHGWTREYCDQIEILYKSFLCLMVFYPEKNIVPNFEIDQFWHAHILDTKKYFTDCQTIFGQYIHHYPYIGLNGGSDQNDLDQLFGETLDLVQKHFPELLQ